MKSWICGGLFVLVFVGVSAAEDTADEAKAFKTHADTANVYFARKTENMGALIDFQVLVDDSEMLKLPNGTFSNLLLEPGTHKVEVRAGLGSTTLNLKVAAGKLYFYQLGPQPKKALLEPEISLVILEPMGKLMVSQSRYTAPNP